MKKVSLLILVSILLLLAFSSCTLLFEEQLPDYSQQGHVHEYGENWITDDAGHLHECECGAEKDYALHYDDNADMLCDACGADMPLPNVQYVVTVIATDEEGKLFFGNSLVVQHGDDATFDLMVGVEYTLSVSEGAAIVATTTANGYKTYTFIVENVTADVTVSVSSEICKHEWLDPTCVAPAICDICGLTEGDPLGHNYSSVATPPTCTENGYDTYTCGVCGDSYSVDTLDALGHSAADPVEENRTEPTCTEPGSYDTAVYCTACSEELSRVVESIDALGHSYSDVVTDPTCTESGYTTHTCSVCSDSYVDSEVDALGHTEKLITGEAPTCTESGITNFVVCEICDATLVPPSVIPANGHVEKTVDGYAPTCTATGLTDGVVCDACGETLVAQTVINANGHTAGAPTEENRNEATCTVDGSYDIVVYCTVCDAELSRTTETLTAPGHAAGAPVEENRNEATCTVDGSYDTVVYCTVCDAELSRTTETLTALGHTEANPVEENRTAPTCTVDGSYDTVVYCTVCSEELSRNTETLTAPGHTDGTPTEENRTAPTCTVDGSYDTVVYCTVCDAELSRTTETLTAPGHTEANPVEENRTAPTCTVDGSYDTVVYCTVCSEELSRNTETLTAPGHTNGTPTEENRTAPTCTVDGSYDTVVYCTVCSEELSRNTETLTAPGHTNGTPVEENRNEATCTVDGSYDTVVYCTVCSEELSRNTETLTALGHTEAAPVEENRTNATCTVDGSYDTVVYCTVCDAEVSRNTETITALGHTEAAPVEENRTNATCTVDGSYDTVVYCTVCSEELSRNTETLTAPGHTNSTAVKENVVAPTCCADGSYDLVVRCTVCTTLISSESYVDPKTGIHSWKDNSDGIGASCTTAGCTATAIKQWQKITSASNLNVGDKIVIVAAGSNAAMSTNQKDNNRGQIAIAKSGNYVTINNSVQIFTVQAGKTSGTYAFYTGSGYIFAASSGSNYLRTETTLSNNSSWSVTITSAGVATVKATGSNTKNWLRYNSTSSLFSCYSSGQTDIALYELVYVECNHSGNTNKDDNNCSTAVKCSLCGGVLTEAIEHSYSYACDSACDNTGCTYVRSVTHTPEEDDGDCTTEINCGVCGVVTTPAAAAHTPNADDDDCTTAVTCSVCDTVVVAAKAHSFTGEYEYDDEGHWRICQNSGCDQLEAKDDHISSGEATATEAEVCTACGYIITPMTGCEHTNITVEYSDDQHWEVCDSCGATFNYADHVSDEDDGSCLTAVICTGCDYVFVAAKADHTAPSSIADCTKDVLCVDCGTLISEGKAEHSITEDNNCETAAVCSICNIVVTPAKTHNYGSDKKCTNEGCDQIKPLVTKTYSYTFTSKQFSSNSAVTLSDVSWTLAGSGSYWGYTGTKGQQFGSGSAPYKSLTLTSGTSFSNVSKIVINASTANSATATMVVKVNGKQVASQKLTNSATSYTFNVSNITGTVEISITQTTSKALYIKSIDITYAE